MHDLIHRLIAAYRPSPGHTAELWTLSGLHAPEAPERLTTHLIRALAWGSALLLGAGLIFWVAANWQDQTRQFKFYLLQAAVVLSVMLALVLPRARTAALLLATLVLGGLLAFIGQTYQTGADPWQLFAVWAALSLLWIVAARSDLLWAVWVLITGLAIGLWSGEHLFSATDWILPGWRHKQALTPLLWAALVALAWAMTHSGWPIASRDARWRMAMRLAVVLALSAWTAYSVADLWRKDSWWFAFSAGLIVLSAWLAYRDKPRDISLLSMTVLALDIVGLTIIARVLFGAGDRSGDWIGLVMIFGLFAAGIVAFSANWLYKLQQQQAKESA